MHMLILMRHRLNFPQYHPLILMLVLNLGHPPLYRHFCKCLYIEMLKIHLFIKYSRHFICYLFKLIKLICSKA